MQRDGNSMSVFLILSTASPILSHTQLQMVVLSQEMVADSVPIDPWDLVKLKFHVAIGLGFRDAKLRESMPPGSLEVSYGELDPKDSSALMTCLSGLKRVLDVSKQISWPRMSSDAEPMRELVGAVFVEVVVRVICSDIDLAKLPYLPLRDLLDCLLIVVYKHELQSKTAHSSPAAEGITDAIRRVTALLPSEAVAFDNRLLIIAISSAALERYPKLVISILGRQILAFAQMMGSDVRQREDALFVQGKTFLQSAFSKYATNGLFVLLFKVMISVCVTWSCKLIVSFAERCRSRKRGGREANRSPGARDVGPHHGRVRPWLRIAARSTHP
jgi:hypothetical protein